MNLPSTSLWEFSSTIYRRPGIEKALLSLQRRFGVDVNMLLACCWAARYRHQKITPSGMTELVEKARVWQSDVVRPLRLLRNRLKTGFVSISRLDTQALRGKVLALEIEAEQAEQDYLAAELPRRSVALDSSQLLQGALANITAYVRLLDIELDEESMEHLATIVSAAFDGAPEHVRVAWKTLPKAD